VVTCHVCVSLINLWMSKPIFMKLGVYTKAPDCISTSN
jgi:hypothetical protein